MKSNANLAEVGGTDSIAAQSLPDRARALFDLIDAEAENIERSGTVTEPVVTALKDSGIFDMMLPRELGGSDVDVLTALEVFEEITRANVAAGWVALVNATVAASAATYVSDEAAQQIFGDGKAILAGAFSAGGGTIKPTEGGYIFEGRFRFGSGIGHANWVAGNAPVLDEAGEPLLGPGGIPLRRIVFVPRDKVELRGNWGDVMGLKGSGSYDFDVVETFVPEGFTFLLNGDEVKRNKPLGHFGVGGLIAIGQAGFPLGAAQRALDEIRAMAPKRARMGHSEPIGNQQMFQYGYAFHESALEAARSHVRDIFAKTAAYAAEHDAPPPVADYLRLNQATCYAHRVAMEVIRFCFSWAGSQAIHPCALERIFRDMETANQHLFYDNMNFVRRTQFLLMAA
ncbi:MAG TPA: acyl-CoA dehydrogenase family protein [Sphingobium sp.]|nr:acyl-CoA dehydrogenase family protein [Sphingobium sp.]